MMRSLWTLGAFLSIVITAYAAAVLLVPGFGPPFVAELRGTSFVSLAAHIGGGLVALAIGPWQFSARLRARRMTLHRWMGRTYVVAVIVGGLGGLMLSRTSQQGVVTHLGFGALAVVWILSTVRAWQVIRIGDDVAHRAWMTRSFALTFAAVTLRIILPLELALGLSFHAAYQIVSWACWLPNLVAAEWLNARRSRPVTPHAALVRTA
jgi:uncharacterized membrane protein